MFFKKQTSIDAIIVGLGNPGKKYEGTRHNAGFAALDHVAEKWGVRVTKAKFDALTGTGTAAGVKVLLMKPQTFMNLSGDAVRKAADFYKVPPERIIVLFDDISLAPGRLRIRKTGSAGGHNGIKSIDRSLGTSKYARVRMGVGHAQRGAHAHDNTVNWVLGGFGPDQRKQLPEFLADGADAAETIIFDGLAKAQERFNGR